MLSLTKSSMITVFGLALVAGVLHAQEPLTTDAVYQMPPANLAAIVDAPPTPGVSLAPAREWMLLMHRPSLPPISELAEPELRLAGMRIKPATNGPSRSGWYNGLTLKHVTMGTERDITGVPVDGRISEVRWSADGAHIAFLVTTSDHIQLWKANTSNGEAQRLTDREVNDTYGVSLQWADNSTVVVKLIPEGRGAAPTDNPVPTGPTIQQNLGEATPARTYQDLLKNSHDESLFDHYFTSQLALVTLDGTITELGKAGVFSNFVTSPDGRFILVQQRHRPYSYQFPASRFPNLIEVWERNGEVVHTVADLPLADNIPIGIGSVAEGPRSVSWRSDAAATLAWTEARDGGNIMQEADIRDEVFLLEAPFDGDATSLVELGQRFGGITWGDGEHALVWSWLWRTRNQQGLMIAPDNPAMASSLLFDYSWQDRYNDPGNPLTEPTEWGTLVLKFSDDGRHIFLSGNGASDEGDRPFLDRMELASGTTERLWRSEAPHYERAIDLLDADRMTMLTSRESATEPANFYVRTIGSDDLHQITHFEHPYPAMLGVSKEMITYSRADGVGLTGTLYLPPDYDEADGGLPTLLWAYPTEYKSADAAGQVQGSPHQFTRVGWWSPVPWVLAGYAVFDDPSLPIIGEGEVEPNDTFIDQLVAGARAAIDVLTDRGVTDPNRVGIGGHSYGAFMTANLLAHSDLFRAGIARSGAYNRTLTPFGFQAEERKFWEAPEIYFAMSPFMHADKIDEPMLMIHGEVDNNSGTFPMQSERMFAAMKGLGGTARLVMLPEESHGYRARESVMHMMWEMTEWLDRYVKTAEPREELTP